MDMHVDMCMWRVIKVLRELSEVHLKRNELAECGTHVRRAIEEAEKSKSSAHPDAAKARVVLAELFMKQVGESTPVH